MVPPGSSEPARVSESEDDLHWMRLHLAFLYRPQTADRLLEECGTPAALVSRSAPTSEPSVGRSLKKLSDPELSERARCQLARCAREGIDIIRRGAATWPGNLEGLPEMPLLLFSRGTWSADDRLSVAIVGSRRPTPYGVREARRFAKALALAGVTVVSGLARGIDGESHRAALEASGRTIAVLGSGLKRIYPPENRHLAEKIIDSGHGVLVSEFPCDAAPLKHHFPQRNRIISALSLALLVVEASERSGSLLTVDWALQQNRPVFVLPGRVDQREARGCLRLIQHGAYPVLDPEELLEVLPLPRRRSSPLKKTTAPAETAAKGAHEPMANDRFFRRLLPLFEDRDSWHPDELAERLGLDPATLLAELARLEAEGRLEHVMGGRYALR